MHSRAALALTTLIAAASAAPAAAAATDVSTSPVLRDCAQHPQGLIHRHPLTQLRSAQDQIPPDVAEYSHCAIEIKSQIAGYVARRGSARTSALLSDCEKHGALTRRYAAPVLRRAATRVPPDVAEYGTCTQAITSQLSLHRHE